MWANTIGTVLNCCLWPGPLACLRKVPLALFAVVPGVDRPALTASKMNVGQIPWWNKVRKITPVRSEERERTHHNLWHAVHWNIQCIETIQTIVRSKLEQRKLDDLADGHEYARFNNENDDESVTAYRRAKIFGIQGSCNIPPKFYNWDWEKEYHKSDVPDSSDCETSNQNICDHWDGKHTLSPLNSRWYIRIWQEVLSDGTISGDFKMWMSKNKLAVISIRTNQLFPGPCTKELR